ncbi:IGR protein motif-domain-containing protein [Ganoderma leucocontextum]|nr:IGR protein motif-domain-containing protein [Ganoderma leucocontextum]
MTMRLAARIQPFLPSLTRSVVNRSAQHSTPPARAGIRTPEAFLKAIGRSCETKLTGVQSWSQLWQTNSFQLKKAGLGVRDRRYILWSMEKFRQGQDPADFAHRAQPEKKIRGRGPAVQNGKRLRSRRQQ